MVTGAARGIGRAAAIRLASDGCAVMLSGRSADALESVAAEIQQSDGRAACVAGDLCNADVPQRLPMYGHPGALG